MDEADADDAGGDAAVDLEGKIEALRERRATLREYRDKLEESGRGQLSLTDPDSRVMRTGKGGVVGYNVQIAVDVKHSLIAEQRVYNNLNDFGLLAQTAVAARENLAVDRIDAVADKGYYKIDDIEACEAGGVTAHVPKPEDRSPTKKKGPFTKSRFRYDGATDSYACPGGQRLRPTYFHQLAGGTRRARSRVDEGGSPKTIEKSVCPTLLLGAFCVLDQATRAVVQVVHGRVSYGCSNRLVILSAFGGKRTLGMVVGDSGIAEEVTGIVRVAALELGPAIAGRHHITSVAQVAQVLATVDAGSSGQIRPRAGACESMIGGPRAVNDLGRDLPVFRTVGRYVPTVDPFRMG